MYLFDDEQGEEELLELDAKIGKLPGLADIKLMSRALYAARERVRRNPDWAWRLIEKEEWANKPGQKMPGGEVTGRRAAGNKADTRAAVQEAPPGAAGRNPP